VHKCDDFFSASAAYRYINSVDARQDYAISRVGRCIQRLRFSGRSAGILPLSCLPVPALLRHHEVADVHVISKARRPSSTPWGGVETIQRVHTQPNARALQTAGRHQNSDLTAHLKMGRALNGARQTLWNRAARASRTGVSVAVM